MRFKHGVPAAGTEWTERSGITLFGIACTDRVKDVINTSFAIARKREQAKNVKELVSNIFVNTSQSISRLPMSTAMPTPTTSAVVYSFGLDRAVSSRAYMRMLGWPSNILPEMSTSEYRLLSGNAFSVPIASMLLAILYLNPQAPWTQG